MAHGSDAAHLLSVLADALNACERGGLAVSLRHDTVIAGQGYVIRFGTGWEPRMRLPADGDGERNGDGG